MSAHTDDVLQSIVGKVKDNIVTLLFALPAFGVMTGWLFKDLSELVTLDYAIALRSFSVLYFSLPLLVLALSLLPIRNIRQNKSVLFRRYFKAEFICFFIIIHLLGTLSNQSFVIDTVFIIECLIVLGFLVKYHTTLGALYEIPIIGLLLIVALSIAFLGFPWNVFSDWNIFPIVSIIGTLTILYLVFFHTRKPEFKTTYNISLYATPICIILLLTTALSLDFNNPFIAKTPDLPDGKEKMQLLQSKGAYDTVFQNYKDADSMSKSYQWVTDCESDIRRLANICSMEKELTTLKAAIDSRNPIVAAIERITKKHDTISRDNILEAVKGNYQLNKAFEQLLQDTNKQDLLLKLGTIIAILRESSAFTIASIPKPERSSISVLLAQVQWRGIFIFGLSCVLLLFYRVSKREQHSKEKLQSLDASILILFLLLLPLFTPIKEETGNSKEPYWFITLPNWYLPGTIGDIINSSSTVHQSNAYVQKQDLEPVMHALQDLQMKLEVNIDSVERLRGLMVENLDTAKNIQKLGMENIGIAKNTQRLGVENLDTSKSLSQSIGSVQQTTATVLNLSDAKLMSKNDALMLFNTMKRLITTVDKNSSDDNFTMADSLAKYYMGQLRENLFQTPNNYQERYEWR